VYYFLLNEHMDYVFVGSPNFLSTRLSRLFRTTMSNCPSENICAYHFICGDLRGFNRYSKQKSTRSACQQSRRNFFKRSRLIFALPTIFQILSHWPIAYKRKISWNWCA